ncbi:hypothetical protein AT705_17185 [Pseudoalteromonas rubra]|uniref:Uncharacterized protein n=1 Tax=Pseudoalteromonas rubra TaxID=43658 RepID=A0A0U3I9V6_9GAMM|nr:hypothetical protein AT705_17185 [Pseudoalteromonas rubra]
MIIFLFFEINLRLEPQLKLRSRKQTKFFASSREKETLPGFYLSYLTLHTVILDNVNTPGDLSLPANTEF